MKKIILEYRIPFILIVLITAVYFLVRLPNLTIQPIFADEAIYIRWAQVMRSEPTLRFLPLSDGKTPLFMWVMISLFKLFKDPLFSGRFLSVISGYFTLLGVLFLGWKFFNRRVGLWAAFIVAVTPFTVFFDRMALVDSMLAAFSIWSLNGALLLIKYPRIDLAMLLGYLLGGGLLTKTPALFFILSLPSTLLSFKWKSPRRERQLLKIFFLWVITIVITFAIYNILRLGPGFDSVNSRNQDYVFSPYELRGRWLDPFIPHFKDLMDIFPKLLSWPILVLSLGGMILAIFKRNRYLLAVLAWGLTPLLIEMAFLKTFTARYTLFSVVPFLFIAGWLIALLCDKLTSLRPLRSGIFALLLPIIISVAVAVWPGYINYQFINNTAQGLLPESEAGYWRSWTAGYGLEEIARFLDQESQKSPVVVGTEGGFGTLPEGLQIYLDKNRQVAVIGGGHQVSEGLREAAKKNRTFFVANRSYSKGIEEGLTLIKDYPKVSLKGRPSEAVFLFEVSPILKK